MCFRFLPLSSSPLALACAVGRAEACLSIMFRVLRFPLTYSYRPATAYSVHSLSLWVAHAAVRKMHPFVARGSRAMETNCNNGHCFVLRLRSCATRKLARSFLLGNPFRWVGVQGRIRHNVFDCFIIFF